jgi:hypothetical protein
MAVMHLIGMERERSSSWEEPRSSAMAAMAMAPVVAERRRARAYAREEDERGALFGFAKLERE